MNKLTTFLLALLGLNVNTIILSSSPDRIFGFS